MSAVLPAQQQASIPRWKSLSRWQAFSIHFALSLLVFLTLVALMVAFWFPGELFLLDGGWQGLKLVAIVDLVLGPLLTLVLWAPEKRGMMFDICVIAALQIAALVYGFTTTYNQRTVAMVYSEQSFVSLSNADLKAANQFLIEKDIAPVPLSEFNSGTPAVLISEPPTRETYGKYLTDLLNGYPEPSARSDKHMDVADGREAMQKTQLDDEKLESLGWNETLQQVLDKKSLNKSDFEFYHYKTRYSKGLVLFNPKTLSIVDYVPMEPSITETAESNE